MMRTRLRANFVLWLAIDVLASTAAIELNKDNFAQMTINKAVFLSFYSPYCNICEDMKPAWRQLEQEYAESETAVVGSIDCMDKRNTLWCQKYITGFSTIMYGDTVDDNIYLEEYRGERDFDTLSDFGRTFLHSLPCSPANLDGCDPKTKKTLERYLSMSLDEIENEIVAKEHAMEDARVDFQSAFDSLQREYDRISMEREQNIADTKRSIQLIKAIRLEKSRQIDLSRREALRSAAIAQ